MIMSGETRLIVEPTTPPVEVAVRGPVVKGVGTAKCPNALTCPVVQPAPRALCEYVKLVADTEPPTPNTVLT